MSLLNTNSTPAERMRGITFSELFKDPASVVENGGTISEAEICNGATFDGTNDYITYNLVGGEFTTECSILIEFSPDFGTDENAERVIFDTEGNGTGRILIRKKNNASGNVLDIRAGSFTPVESISEETYSPFWKTGEKNQLVLTLKSGDSSAWLNGNKILDSASSAFTFEPLNKILFGVRKDLNSNFAGRITQFKIFNSLLTAQEALDFYNGTTYDYMNDAVVNLPMGACQHDPSNTTGVELVTDGDMEAPNTSAWTAGNNAVLTKETSSLTGSQVLQIDYNSTNFPNATQTGVLTVGKQYRLTGEYINITGSSLPKIDDGSTQIYEGTTGIDELKTFDITFTATSTSIRLRQGGVGDNIIQFDNVSVELLESRTLDISGNENNGLLGDGTTASTFPTKLQKKGYEFDGGDYISLNNGSEIEPTNTFSFAGVFKYDNPSATHAIISKYNFTESKGFYLRVQANLLDLSIEANTYRIKSSQLQSGTYYTFVVTYDSVLGGQIFINGLDQSDSISGTPNEITPTTTDVMEIGSRTDIPTDKLVGELRDIKYFSSKLTPVQAADLHIKLMSNINKV